MKKLFVEQATNGASEPLEINKNQANFRVSVQVSALDGFAGTWDLQYQLDKELPWVSDSVLVGQSGSVLDTLVGPVERVRVVVAGRTNGKVLLARLQGA